MQMAGICPAFRERRDKNPDQRFWTQPFAKGWGETLKNQIIFAGALGFEPRPTVLETVMLPLTPRSHQKNMIILNLISLKDHDKRSIFF